MRVSFSSRWPMFVPMSLTQLMCDVVLLQSMSSADDVLKLDMRQYEHAINDSELEIVRQSMLNGKTGEYTVMVWLPLKREVRK